MENYTILHLHDMLSNAITNIDSVTKYDKYINRAKELGMSAIAFTNHGSVLDWHHKMQYCNSVGIKYIHGIEMYVTKSLDEKVRDNYHMCMYAKNNNGKIELNKLSSKAFNRQDNSFYYTPRITFQDVLNTSDNIIITTACLGGILNSGDEELESKLIEWMKLNKHRCFLEIQHHLVKDQIEFNKKLYAIHKETGIPLTVGTDTHALDDMHLKGRSILQKSKKIYFDNEEGWDLKVKTYDGLIDCFKQQNIIPMGDIIEALENTNRIADMVEKYEFDTSFKYPKLYDESELVFRDMIEKGVVNRGIDKLENFDVYKERIEEEFDTMKAIGAIDYMLLQKKILDDGRDNGVQSGFGRGSVSGSLIAYLLGITEVDAVKFNTNFFRFMNPSRISLCDIDVDFGKSDREWIREYIFNMEGVYTSEIITFNTIADLGAIRDVGRALEMPLEEVDIICKSFETNEENLRKKYQELFEYVDIIRGTVVSVGTHPSGIVVSPTPLDGDAGLMTLSTTSHPVSQLNMKSLDNGNWVKLDVLGLDNINVINETCKYVGIDRLNPDNIDYNDEEVYKSIIEDTTTIFQMESNVAKSYINQIFSKQSLENIKNKYGKVDMFSILDFCNGAIRPSGESFRDKAAKGICGETGIKELDDMLFDTLGYVLTQEQIMEFLNKFCGYSMSKSDQVRRAIGKKLDTTQFIDDIKKEFIKYSVPKYNLDKDRAESVIDDFIQVIISANRYGFSRNHSFAYTSVSVACAWLRYYYPLEYLTSCFNTWADDQDKTDRITTYAFKVKINVLSPVFRKSKGDYFFDKDTNSIYKGIGSIKYMNNAVGDELYELRYNQYESFIDLLQDISKTSCNSRQLDILIKIGFFNEFGCIKQLLETVEIFNTYNTKKTVSKDKIVLLGLSHIDMSKYATDISEKTGKETKTWKLNDVTGLIKELCEDISKEEYDIKTLIGWQNEILGYVSYTNANLEKRYAFVQSVDGLKGTRRIKLYCLNNGKTSEFKVGSRLFASTPFKQGDILYTTTCTKKLKAIPLEKDDKGAVTKWGKSDISEWWLDDYRMIKEI